jgi:hypothetical protein
MEDRVNTDLKLTQEIVDSYWTAYVAKRNLCQLDGPAMATDFFGTPYQVLAVGVVLPPTLRGDPNYIDVPATFHEPHESLWDLFMLHMERWLRGANILVWRRRIQLDHETYEVLAENWEADARIAREDALPFVPRLGTATRYKLTCRLTAYRSR